MKIKIILLLAFMIAASAAHASAQGSGLAGKWSGNLTTPDGNDLQTIYTFKVDGDKLTGTGETQAGTVTLDNGKVTGNKFSFKVTIDGTDYPHTGTFKDDTCEMDIVFGEYIVHVTLKREKGSNDSSQD